MKTNLFGLILLLVFPLILSGCKNKTTHDYLQEVLVNLESIKSATYYIQTESWQPGDSTAATVTCSYNMEFDNPADTTIGASFARFSSRDTTFLKFAYDGKVRAVAYPEQKSLMIDDFTARPLPFRPLKAPFFNYAKNIIQYILATNDSTEVNHQEFDNHHYIKLSIHEDTQVEFFGKAHHLPEPSFYVEPTSIYELWIHKSDALPYKVRREMSHSISVDSCYRTEFNNLSINDFSIYAYFPTDYKVRNYALNIHRKTTPELIGKPAPQWILTDLHEQTVSLSDLKSKVLLINFTGIGCGPCLASTPFLKELKKSYNPNDFSLIGIESWVRKPQSLQNYTKKNNLNYKLLSATDQVLKDYKTGGAAPVFIILDKNQTVRYVINGYSPEPTEKEIKEAVERLIKE